jgi:hypothetical protein
VAAQSLSDSRRLGASLVPSGRQRSEAVDVDRGQLVRRFLKDVAIVMDLHEFAPVGGRPASWRDWRRCERFTEVGENLPDRPRFGDECDEPDISCREWVEVRTQLHRSNCVFPALNRKPIGQLPTMRRSGRTDVGDLGVSLNALTPSLQPLYAVG